MFDKIVKSKNVIIIMYKKKKEQEKIKHSLISFCRAILGLNKRSNKGIKRTVEGLTINGRGDMFSSLSAITKVSFIDN